MPPATAPHTHAQDSLEIIRGKAGRVFGQMSAVVVALKGLPTTYNKDMAEDKDHLLDCVFTVQDVVRILEGVVATLTVRCIDEYVHANSQIKPERMRGALSADMLATDLAEYLVMRGVSHLVAQSYPSTADRLGALPRDTPHLGSRCRRRRGKGLPNLRPII